MKPEDFAQELELKEYEATQRRAIQPKRQKATAVTRCVECQEDFEMMKRRGE
ncbi:MAG: hypothetical protein JNL77_08880 [Nitrosomonas sp.]|nr:hypothetical protein [Nitrosomonas sp.]